MRSLTLSVPWGFAVARLGKRVENRTWCPPRWLIGQQFAIHNGRSRDNEAIAELRAHGFDVPLVHAPGVAAVAHLRGVLFYDHARAATLVHIAGDLTKSEVDAVTSSIWWSGPFGWVLGDVVPIEPVISCKGMQGLWTLPSEVERQVHDRLAARSFAPGSAAP